jgi:hypothetical protein
MSGVVKVVKFDYPNGMHYAVMNGRVVAKTFPTYDLAAMYARSLAIYIERNEDLEEI